ncbi:MAG TPA: hypothetical protein VHY37_13140, partial [Tepidisphaeraceae bacterium]|nr:hypothetical protein [Tepidisphaeraceae bacterium]
ARAFAFQGSARGIAPAARSVGYMANGSFHGELLSVRETKPISLTHQRAQSNASAKWNLQLIRN